jgi:hypothetical protein
MELIKILFGHATLVFGVMPVVVVGVFVLVLCCWFLFFDWTVNGMVM